MLLYCKKLTIARLGEHSYVFSRYLEPIARVSPGETVSIYTKVAFGNWIVNESDVPREILGDYLNPQTGSIYPKMI